MKNCRMADEKKYIIRSAEPLQLPDTRHELQTSLAKIVTGCPPTKPWTDTFKNRPIGLWTGPTSLAYLFLWLSYTHPDLRIGDRTPHDWCLAYLDCGSDDLPMNDGDCGIKNEFLAFHAVKAVATKDFTCVQRLLAAVADLKAPTAYNEYLSGRAGTLTLLRIVSHFLPDHRERISTAMKPIIEHILANRPWSFNGTAYAGAGHGDIGIITQIVLSDPSYAPQVEDDLRKLLDQQTPTGHWYVRNGRDDPVELVQFCHGSPGFVLSCEKIKPYFPALQDAIEKAIGLGRNNVQDRGLLKKEPNLCHGATGNAFALPSPQREELMAYTTAEYIESGLKDGSYIRGDDPYGLGWGEAGRAWSWMVLDSGQDIGFAAYTDI